MQNLKKLKNKGKNKIRFAKNKDFNKKKRLKYKEKN